MLAAIVAVAATACSSESGGTTESLQDPDPGPPQFLVVASPSRQTGLPDTDVWSGPVVKVTDAADHPLPDVPVDFRVTAGGGSVSPGTALSGADGLVRASWHLGEAGAQELRATSAQVPDAVALFSAQAIGGDGYRIDLRLLTSATDAEWEAFTAAADRISQVITGGVTPAVLDGESCDGTALSGTAQLLILVRLQYIDGSKGILAQSGPCLLRHSSRGAGLPAAGIMEFDTADLEMLESQGTLRSTILHEMLHVVGFGSLWSEDGLVSGVGSTDSAFLGPWARDAAVYDNGAPRGWKSVPLENCVGRLPTQCGAGTRDVHWLESTFRSELMTGWLSGKTQPLSRTTVGSLADLGYTVNLGAADPFTLPGTGAAALRAPASAEDVGEYLADDVLRLPIHVLP